MIAIGILIKILVFLDNLLGERSPKFSEIRELEHIRALEKKNAEELSFKIKKLIAMCNANELLLFYKVQRKNLDEKLSKVVLKSLCVKRKVNNNNNNNKINSIKSTRLLSSLRLFLNFNSTWETIVYSNHSTIGTQKMMKLDIYIHFTARGTATLNSNGIKNII